MSTGSGWKIQRWGAEESPKSPTRARTTNEVLDQVIWNSADVDHKATGLWWDDNFGKWDSS